MNYFFLMSVMIAAARGTNLNVSEDRYVVSIQKISNLRNHCGGSLVRLDRVLTAAHCMDLPPNHYIVSAGITDLTKTGEDRFIRTYVNHPYYNSRTKDYDISVIKLEERFSDRPSIKPIKYFKIPRIISDNTIATVTGWDTPYSNNLRRLTVYKYNHRQCRKELRRFNHLTRRMTCFKSGVYKRDTCQGDSGSPAVVGNYQVAIVSWGHFCGDRDLPGAYTDLTNWKIITFINANVK